MLSKIITPLAELGSMNTESIYLLLEQIKAIKARLDAQDKAIKILCGTIEQLSESRK